MRIYTTRGLEYVKSVNTRSDGPFFQDPFGDLLPDSSHDSSSRVRTAPAKPNSSHLPAHSVGEEVVESDRPVENVPLSQPQHVFEVVGSENVDVVDVKGLL